MAEDNNQLKVLTCASQPILVLHCTNQLISSINYVYGSKLSPKHLVQVNTQDKTHKSSSCLLKDKLTYSHLHVSKPVTEPHLPYESHLQPPLHQRLDLLTLQNQMSHM